VTTTRKVGLVLAAVATVLWAVIVVAVLATAPEDGVNIGAAFLAILTVPLSIMASATLIASWRSDVRGGRPDERPLARRIAAVLAVVSSVCLAGTLVLGPWIESVEQANAAIVVVMTGITSFVASSALFALPRSRRS